MDILDLEFFVEVQYDTFIILNPNNIYRSLPSTSTSLLFVVEVAKCWQNCFISRLIFCSLSILWESWWQSWTMSLQPAIKRALMCEKHWELLSSYSHCWVSPICSSLSIQRMELTIKFICFSMLLCNLHR